MDRLRLNTDISLQQAASARSLASFPNLLDPRFDQDSCGVGFVANVSGEPSHEILQHALTALARLEHRGAVAADGKSSDGVGVMTAIPRDILLLPLGIELDRKRPLGVAVVFLEGESLASRDELEAAFVAQQIAVLAWRPVPICPQILGSIAASTLPNIWHVLVTSDEDADLTDFDRRLYLARKQFERSALPGYVASISSSTIIYKALCAGRLLPQFYPDLENPEFKTPFTVFHQRYATNVLPSWDRAQPCRTLAHNGEINTIWGNRSRMDARAATLPLDLHPVLTEGGSDSTSLDEVVELLSQNGRTVAESLRMLVPPANHGNTSSFLQYSGDCVEPWDGPAALAFADGRQVGAILDRNGLRPCRFAIDEDGLVVAGSEAGLVDMDPEKITHSGRLGPGQMILVDLETHEFLENEELLARFDKNSNYKDLVQSDAPLVAAENPSDLLDAVELNHLQHRFGYTREEVRMMLAPMAAEGKEAIWSMGDDTPVAPLARSPRPVYSFFRQRFAQVTNPPIDPLREAVVLQMHTRLGPWPHIFEPREPLPGLSLSSPLLSLAEMYALKHQQHSLANELPLEILDCVFSPEGTLEASLDALLHRAVELIGEGKKVLVLSDRAASESALPIPMAMALGAVHIGLIRAGIRTEVGLAVEAGDCRDIHHVALLLGMGAGTICPWLALETARALTPENGEANMLHALELGLAKVMSKMGISVVDSYRGAHLFDALGLSDEVIDKCFFGTPSPLSGIGFAEVEKSVRQSWRSAVPAPEPANASDDDNGTLVTPTAIAPTTKDLPDYGFVRFRKAEEAEPHAWQPQTVRALQAAMGSTKQGAALALTPWSAFATQATDTQPAAIRDLLEIRPAGPEFSLEEVEAPGSLVKNFIASAMSFGSLSPEAHQTITQAMNLLGARSNTGEGGEDPAVYADIDGAPSLLNNKIKQVASGRFGVTAEYLIHAEEIEIKVAQGAKPGEGGQLPGYKVTELIARLRHAQPGMQLISPPPHHDIYSIEDLAQLIYDLKRVNPRATIGVKLVSEWGVGTVAAGVAKAYADYIVIAGHTGGTGASSLSSIKYAGDPWELGLAEAQQVLIHNGLRGRVRLRTDGGLRTARDILIAALLGADEFAFGTSVLVALGCDMARQCHLNTCPTGIATQKPELRAKFRGKPEHVVRMFDELAHELQQLLASLGLPSLAAATGRTDLLEQVRFEGGLNLAPILGAATLAQSGAPIRWQGGRNDRPEEHPAIDDAWVEPAFAAYKSNQPFSLSTHITNENRTLGARLAGEIAKFKTNNPTASGSALHFDLKGVAGQSFGAFAVAGMTLKLQGIANDFVGKGLCGGELILKGEGRAARESTRHVILGNVALYGATSGELYAAGRAGERFAVRNSGALAIVEGCGDHGCEYMTGGLVVILGDTGINFGAGMTGGLAWVYDDKAAFIEKNYYHPEFLLAEKYDELDYTAQHSIRELVELHSTKTASSCANVLLTQWDKLAKNLIRLTPKTQV
ncbi:glutamate synthase large subunit [Acidicapsa ligni]|uniref:glutamate synthase large subunit n=1 Tax=Acidicapsa ligni TaxID=542300 RepID=UPI0021DFE3D8|nr:glutamate synthase large subunit [Acidicapsa ligni]